jgi:hypothetical protein
MQFSRITSPVDLQIWTASSNGFSALRAAAVPAFMDVVTCNLYLELLFCRRLRRGG